MFQYKCLNPISPCGTSLFTEEYKQVEELQKADAVLVRSAAMHDMQDVPNLLAVARAGAGVNNIPIADYSEKGIVVFNTPGANANGVKEMVIAGMLLASRDLIGGNKWVEENKEDPNITKAMEKAKKAFAGREIQNKKIGVIGLGAIGGFIGGNVFAFYKMLHSKRIRKALTDIVADKIETVLYGEECHSPKNNSRVSYSYYHKNKNIRNKSGFVLEDILFGTESDALSVLSSMKEIIVNYGCVSIADYYDLAGLPSNVYTNTKYGWLDLKDAKVIDSMDGYKISLPKVLILN